MSKLSLFAFASDSRIDVDTGILRGVSLITKGTAKGHEFLGEPIIADDTTLDEVTSAAQGFTDGVPVMFDHGSGISDLVGAIKDVYRDGEKVRGDLYLLKTHESYDTIIEMAESMPSNFGLSISFMNAPEPVMGNDEEPDGDGDDDQEENPILGSSNDIVAYAARIAELYSCDLVQAPALNASLFNAMTEPTTTEEVPAVAPEVVVEEVATEQPSPAHSEELPAGENPLLVGEPPVIPAEPVDPNQVVNPLILPEELARLREIETHFSNNRTELTAIRTELASVKSHLAVKEAQLVELNMLHRSVKTVLGLMPADEVIEIVDSTPELSLIDRYEAMSAGPERLAFFQANRRALEKAISARVGNNQ
jgi:hypothetical protein